MKANEITAYINKHIPVTGSMGIAVQEVSKTSIKITAPLGPNINHRESAFGGSISTIGIISCWGLLFSRLKTIEIPTRLVIQKSSTDFLLPATGEMTGECTFPDENEFEKFLKLLKRRGKSRIYLSSQVYSENKLIAEHTGAYVVVAIT